LGAERGNVAARPTKALRPWRDATALLETRAVDGASNATGNQVGDIALAAMDDNGDGVASLNEVESFAKDQGLDYASSMVEFAGFDQNKDGQLDSEELGQAVSNSLSSGGEAEIPRAVLCGGMACGYPSVCCHGICGGPNAFCCGKIVCEANATCCPGVLPGTHLCCHPGARCCGGLCLMEATTCELDAVVRK
jgi:hypothetical protein